MDPPRHSCRGRPMVCPGPCNPLAHHHHHHRHHHQKPGRDIPLPDDFSPMMLLKSLKADVPITPTTSTNNLAISGSSTSTKIAFGIKFSKAPQPKETDNVPAIMQQILSPVRLEMPKEPPKSRSVESVPREIEASISMPLPKETVARIPIHEAPTDDVTCEIMTRLNGLAMTRTTSFFLGLAIFLIYAGIHILLATIAGRTPAYQFFVSSQICGVLAFLMWRLTGTILI